MFHIKLDWSPWPHRMTTMGVTACPLYIIGTVTHTAKTLQNVRPPPIQDSKNTCHPHVTHDKKCAPSWIFVNHPQQEEPTVFIWS